MPDSPLRECQACDGRGYIPCDCWPGDCICSVGDEDCWECEGVGLIDPDDEYDEPEREPAP